MKTAFKVFTLVSCLNLLGVQTVLAEDYSRDRADSVIMGISASAGIIGAAGLVVTGEANRKLLLEHQRVVDVAETNMRFAKSETAKQAAKSKLEQVSSTPVRYKSPGIFLGISLASMAGAIYALIDSHRLDDSSKQSNNYVKAGAESKSSGEVNRSPAVVSDGTASAK